MTVSHLLFTDDTVIFGDADAELLSYIRSVILYFKAVLCPSGMLERLRS